MQIEFNYDIVQMFSGREAMDDIIEKLILYADNNDEIRAELDGMREKCAGIANAEKALKQSIDRVLNKNFQFVEDNKIVARFTYRKEDFNTAEPYAVVFSYASDRFIHETELNKMADEAKSVGFSGFKKCYQAYIKSMRLTNKNNMGKSNPSDFPGQPIELECGQWLCDVEGVRMVDGAYGTQIACCHPIMPTERLVNIDTGEEKINLAFYKSKRWRNMIVSKEVTAVASKITQLAARGVAVTSENAKNLVKYLCDIENMNLEIIPEHESVGRLGFVDEGRFSPYVDGLIFDGEAAYSPIFKAIKDNKGNFESWLEVAKKCRTESLVARIMISASFASALVKQVGALPFFVHSWSSESGTGKTVALMVAASVWGNPEPGAYIQSFNSTIVGHEKMAAFLNNIPLCIDELQLSKDHHGNSRFDVYQLAQGVGRTRGNKSGGVDITPTWSNCILTTGETPIVKDGAGAGAVNRVIDLECPIGQKVIFDGQSTANTVRTNYGHAGRRFLEKVNYDHAKQLYEDYFEALSHSETTEKQSMAAALVLTADNIVSETFFKEKPLEMKELQVYLKTKDMVSVGERGYRYICDWISMNIRYFMSNVDTTENITKIYGLKEGTEWIYINRSIFRQAVEEGGYNDRALLSFLKSKNLIQTRGRHFTRGKRIAGVLTECIVLRMPDVALETENELELI